MKRGETKMSQLCNFSCFQWPCQMDPWSWRPPNVRCILHYSLLPFWSPVHHQTNKERSPIEINIPNWRFHIEDFVSLALLSWLRNPQSPIRHISQIGDFISLIWDYIHNWGYFPLVVNCTFSVPKKGTQCTSVEHLHWKILIKRGEGANKT